MRSKIKSRGYCENMWGKTSVSPAFRSEDITEQYESDASDALSDMKDNNGTFVK